MTKAEWLEFLDDDRIPDNVEIDVIVADCDDNYTVDSDLIFLNEHDGSYELVIQLSEIFEVRKIEC